MDNEETEEKKLHSFVLYLKQFPIHENKTTEELLASIECCPKGELVLSTMIFNSKRFVFRTRPSTERN